MQDSEIVHQGTVQSWKVKQKSRKGSAREKHDHVHVLHLCWQQYNTDLASLPEILRWQGHSLWLTQYNAFTWDIVVWIGEKTINVGDGSAEKEAERQMFDWEF